MYSVTIVWSAFAFIHLRLVSTLTLPLPPLAINLHPVCCDPLSLVLLNVLLHIKVAPPLDAFSPTFHCTVNVLHKC